MRHRNICGIGCNGVGIIDMMFIFNVFNFSSRGKSVYGKQRKILNSNR